MGLYAGVEQCYHIIILSYKAPAVGKHGHNDKCIGKWATITTCEQNLCMSAVSSPQPNTQGDLPILPPMSIKGCHH